MSADDPVAQLAAPDRLRLAAALLDDVVAGRMSRIETIARVIEILALVIRCLTPELTRGR